jgi:hypothetical protein
MHAYYGFKQHGKSSKFPAVLIIQLWPNPDYETQLFMTIVSRLVRLPLSRAIPGSVLGLELLCVPLKSLQQITR